MQAWAAPTVPALPAGPEIRLPAVRLYDSASREVRPLATGDRATLYVCGITPYDATHLGHAATYVAFDTLHRVWRATGIDVDYCQNVTDVDDPLLERAQRDGVDWRELAASQTDLFRNDMAALRVLPPRSYVGAVEAIPQVVDLIQVLQERGATYDVGGDVYFSVAVAPHFGAVGGYDADTMLALSAERGGDPDRAGKKDPLDALLWRRQRPGEPGWESPFGPGRPGWHVECAAIALDRLGRTIDVQGGGADLVFPHHEMSAAHAAVATGEWPFARAFAHAGLVGLAGEKMSKSKGNLVFVSRLLAGGADPAAVRLALLAHHYRADWDWRTEYLAEAQVRLGLWRRAVALTRGPPAGALVDTAVRLLADDLDTPGALRAVDQWCQAATRAAGGSDPDAPGAVRACVDALLGVRLSG